MTGTENIQGTDRQIKNLFVNGHRTSLRLEQAFWDGFESCARHQGKSIHQLANSARSDYAHVTPSLSSAVRMLIIEHFREQAMAAERGFQVDRARAERADRDDPVSLTMSHGKTFLDALRNLKPGESSSRALRDLLREIKSSVDPMV
jgi:predicted DNA-binding ribbon-helix-helix protein